MIKITKKRAAAPTPEPEELVEPRLKEAVYQTPIAKTPAEYGMVAYADKSIAKDMKELLANRATMRAPAPTVCTFCKHPYAFPCEGKAKDCMNAEWIRAGKTTAKVTSEATA